VSLSIVPVFVTVLVGIRLAFVFSLFFCFFFLPLCSCSFFCFFILPLCSRSFFCFFILPLCSCSFFCFFILPLCSRSFLLLVLYWSHFHVAHVFAFALPCFSLAIFVCVLSSPHLCPSYLRLVFVLSSPRLCRVFLLSFSCFGLVFVSSLSCLLLNASPHPHPHPHSHSHSHLSLNPNPNPNPSPTVTSCLVLSCLVLSCQQTQSSSTVLWKRCWSAYCSF
jgi:hypothetical protein